MKIIKLSSQAGSYCSTEPKSISKIILEHLKESIRNSSNGKFVLEVYDINDEGFTFHPNEGNIIKQESEIK